MDPGCNSYFATGPLSHSNRSKKLSICKTPRGLAWSNAPMFPASRLLPEGLLRLVRYLLVTFHRISGKTGVRDSKMSLRVNHTWRKLKQVIAARHAKASGFRYRSCTDLALSILFQPARN